MSDKTDICQCGHYRANHADDGTGECLACKGTPLSLRSRCKIFKMTTPNAERKDKTDSENVRINDLIEALDDILLMANLDDQIIYRGDVRITIPIRKNIRLARNTLESLHTENAALKKEVETYKEDIELWRKRCIDAGLWPPRRF